MLRIFLSWYAYIYQSHMTWNKKVSYAEELSRLESAILMTHFQMKNRIVRFSFKHCHFSQEFGKFLQEIYIDYVNMTNLFRINTDRLQIRATHIIKDLKYKSVISSSFSNIDELMTLLSNGVSDQKTQVILDNNEKDLMGFFDSKINNNFDIAAIIQHERILVGVLSEIISWRVIKVL